MRLRSWSRTSWTGVLLGAVCAMASCIALIDKNADQCDVDGDCAAKGGAFAGRACVNHVCVASTGGGDSAVDSDATTGDSGHDTTDSGGGDVTPPDADGTTDTGPVSAGLFVASGTTASGGVLVAIDPETGAELKRETLSVAAIAYDPGNATATGDVWYVFENGGGTLDGGISAAKLRVRTFDTTSKTWTEVGSLDDIPKPKSSRDVVVMNKRIVYMGDYAGSDPLGVGFIYIVDISTPSAPKLVCTGCASPPIANTVTKSVATDKYLGLVAGGRAADTLTGGTLGVGFVSACTGAGGTCPTFFQRYRYTGNDGTDGTPGVQTSFGSFASDVTVGIGTSFRHRAAFIAVPNTATTGTLMQNPQTFFGATVNAATFDYTGRATFSPIAIAGCEDVALFTTFGNQLLAVPFGGKGFTQTSTTAESASQIAYDTTTNVAAYMANGLQAVRVSFSPKLALTPLSWPAQDYVPTAIRGREPGNACK